ncbi:MAG: hypothetical protein NT105_18595 [Verrucomicrobia bacterium]|nr:hypothetical protein [Verrucomicrobiota bacterium]
MDVTTGFLEPKSRCGKLQRHFGSKNLLLDATTSFWKQNSHCWMLRRVFRSKNVVAASYNDFLGDYIFDSPRAKDILQPHKLISLWDMIRFFGKEFIELFTEHLSFVDRVAQHKIHKDGDSAELVFNDSKYIASHVDAQLRQCEHLGLAATAAQVAHLKDKVTFWEANAPKYQEICTLIEGIRVSLRKDFSALLFAHITSDKAKFFEQEKLFGPEVYDGFESARADIKNAGNCLAADLNTAAIFHLMRVAEWGIRALAFDRRVKFDKGPIEMQGWKAIISNVEGEIKKVSNWPKSKQRAQAEEFYNGALEEFRGFKDAWRNHVMHTRGNYNANDALGVMEHVKRFMVSLGRRITENNRTPIKWTKKQIVSES